MWSGVGPSMTLRVLLGSRDRESCSFVENLGAIDREADGGIKRNKRFSSRPSSGGGSGVFTISQRATPSISGSPVSGLFCSSAYWQVWRESEQAGWPVYALLHGAAWLEAAADAAMSRLGRCGRRKGGRSSCPPGQDMTNRLRLLLCSRELLAKALDRIAKKAGLGHRGIEEPNFVGVPHVSQRWRSWTTSVDIA